MKSPASTGAECEARSGKGWPYCGVLEAECLAHSLAQRLGTQPLIKILSFVATAEPGARLTLQSDKMGFTVQVTNAVEGPGGTQLDLEDFKQLGDLLSGRRRGKE